MCKEVTVAHPAPRKTSKKRANGSEFFGVIWFARKGWRSPPGPWERRGCRFWGHRGDSREAVTGARCFFWHFQINSAPRVS